MNPDLLIVAATPFEMAHFLTLHPGKTDGTTISGLTILSGNIRDKRYDLLISGAGVFNTAHAVTAYLEKRSHPLPPLILQTGIAGVFRRSGLGIGDIAIATNERYIHTGIQNETNEKDPLPFDLIDAMPSTRKGSYPFNPGRVDHFHDLLFRKLSGPVNIKKGRFITVSAITASFTEADRLYETFSPVMEAMEGAACAHIAELYKIPMIEIRSGSNFVGERDKSKWDFDLSIKQLGEACSCL